VIIAPFAQAASGVPTRVSALESSISALERAISALESDIAALENSLPWEYWVYVFTSLVVLGVVMELWVIRHDWRGDMETWALAHVGVLRSPERPSVTKLIGGTLQCRVDSRGGLGRTRNWRKNRLH